MKTVIITGANSGLGFECAKNILSTEPEYFIVMACRNPEKAEVAKSALILETGNKNVEVMALDLSSLQSIRSFTKNFDKASLPPLYGVVCNAGIASTQTGKTADGYELIFGTNHLGHFLLTTLLIPRIEDKGRIVIVSSDMHNPPGGITYPGSKILSDPENGLNTKYFLSKLCNLYFTYELSRRLAKMQKPITVNAINPGFIPETNLNAGNKERFTEDFFASVQHLLGSLPVSSNALAKMITEPHFGEVTARYIDRGNETASSELSYNIENAAELWETSVSLTGLQSDDTDTFLL